MNLLVVDASVFGPYLLKDEWNERAARLLAEMGEHEILVPSHWRLEVANLLISAMRKGRITMDERSLALAGVGQFAITIDDLTSINAWGDTLDLADRYKLTPYDAAYLELALRHQTALATNDRALLIAAEKEGVDTRTSLS